MCETYNTQKDGIDVSNRRRKRKIPTKKTKIKCHMPQHRMVECADVIFKHNLFFNLSLWSSWPLDFPPSFSTWWTFFPNISLFPSIRKWNDFRFQKNLRKIKLTSIAVIFSFKQSIVKFGFFFVLCWFSLEFVCHKIKTENIFFLIFIRWECTFDWVQS